MKRLHKPIYASRIQELVRRLTEHLHPGDHVLDVGCGAGELGAALMDSSDCPSGVVVSGLELVSREAELIPVREYDGHEIPYSSNTFDVVILADVLHHAQHPHKLIDECARVTRRQLIIKDHKLDGILAKPRVALLDWAANMPYDTSLLYRYNTAQQWREWHTRHGFAVEHEMQSMRLYPPIINLLFGRRLQYWVVLRVDDPETGGRRDSRGPNLRSGEATEGRAAGAMGPARDVGPRSRSGGPSGAIRE